MYLGKFLDLSHLFSFLYLTYLNDIPESCIKEFFDIYLYFDGGYTLEYVGTGIYCIYNGNINCYFNSDELLDIEYMIGYFSDDKNNSNSVH